MQSRVGTHNLRHGLLDEGLETREPVAVGRPEVVRQVHANHDTSGRGIDAHRVGDVVEELCTGVTLDVVRVEVTPTKLDINPELVASRTVKDVLLLRQSQK